MECWVLVQRAVMVNDRRLREQNQGLSATSALLAYLTDEAGGGVDRPRYLQRPTFWYY